MNIIFRLLPPVALSAAGLLAQSPAPKAVLNPASNILAGLPNFGIAQGSIFVVYGANMGPAALAVTQSLPLQNTLSGTSVQVTVGGTTLNAPMVYTLQSQFAAVLPSTTPTGNGTLTVTYNGATGSTPIQVVQSNFGISTVNQTGTGPAVVTFADFSLVSGPKAAKPGDTLIIWGTGLGPINGNDAAAPVPIDLGTPVKVFVGGVQANVVYKGRSGQPGLDQINFTVPAGLTGCYLSLVVQTGNTVSNTTTMSISNSGGACSDPNGIDLSGAAANKTSLSIGVVDLLQESLQFEFGGTTTTANVGAGSAIFEKITLPQITTIANPTGQASLNSCLVTSFASAITAGNPPNTTTPPPAITATGLDAGAAIAITPGSGTQLNLTPPKDGTKGVYSGALTTALAPGAYRISNGGGGADVGSFNANVNMPAPLQWTNQTAVTTAAIDRTKPLLLTWTGGAAGSYAFITGTSTSVTSTTVAEATFVCIAPISAGQFSVPPSVLLSLPVSGATLGSSTSILLLGTSSNPQSFTAPGLDIGYFIATSATGGTVSFQ